MADEWVHEGASDEEKLQIAQRFILDSPPGQAHEVLRDVAKIVPPHVLSDEALREVLQAYNVETSIPVDVPDADYKILICKEAEVDATHYVDPIGNRVLGFDHMKQQVVPEDVAELPEAMITDFEHERGTAGVYVVGTKLVVKLCTERVNLRNFWGGRWKSRWEVDLTADPGTVKGSIELHVHYFENGNLQLQSSKDVEEAITIQQPGGLGDALLRVMKEAEDDLQMNLEDMYINMSEETFKEMRRVMPVTQTKMEWSLHAHRTAKDLGRSK
ncbi:unnamed protein product [Hyaloperonospora brassicae]|uniref:F-actin-capping protein subunit alpha n=1 Tax=Hyaloperonospora brassicae TaxID=162125 RepID=A0AAV0TEB8_HYABA|nr:unnamed protein product [Hyaloperonospora brassicae]